MNELETKINEINQYGRLFQKIKDSTGIKRNLFSTKYYLIEYKFKKTMSEIIKEKLLFSNEKEEKGHYNENSLKISFIKTINYIFRKIQIIEDQIITLRNQQEEIQEEHEKSQIYHVYKKLEGELSLILTHTQTSTDYDLIINDFCNKYDEVLRVTYKNKDKILTESKESNSLIKKSIEKHKKNIASFILSITTYRKKLSFHHK